jgi:hypothetical protein
MLLGFDLILIEKVRINRMNLIYDALPATRIERPDRREEACFSED